MKRIFVLSTVLLLALSVSGLAFVESDFSGEWKLDMDKSELGGRSRIESMTMNVTQTKEEIKFQRTAKRAESDDGGRRRGRGFGGGGNAGQTFKLDGSESTEAIERGQITGSVVRTAEMKDGSLVLTIKRELETPRGERKTTSVETWELSEDGKTLTVSTETETPRGTRTSKMVFVKA